MNPALLVAMKTWAEQSCVGHSSASFIRYEGLFVKHSEIWLSELSDDVSKVGDSNPRHEVNLSYAISGNRASYGSASVLS